MNKQQSTKYLDYALKLIKSKTYQSIDECELRLATHCFYYGAFHYTCEILPTYKRPTYPAKKSTKINVHKHIINHLKSDTSLNQIGVSQKEIDEQIKLLKNLRLARNNADYDKFFKKQKAFQCIINAQNYVDTWENIMQKHNIQYKKTGSNP